MIDWSKGSKEELRQIHEIAKRASHIIPGMDLMTIEMDVQAVHTHGCKLKLNELLAADDFNLVHDILGINRHLNRETGKLKDFFLPRFAA